MGKSKAAVPAGGLVRAALLNVATAADAVQLAGKGGLFASASAANKAAIAECLAPAAPLLTVLRAEGKTEFVGLAPAGFERIARELPEERVGPLAKSVAGAVPPAARIDFIQSVIGRTPLAAAELLPVLEEAVAAEKAEQEARVEAAKARRAAEQAALAALERVKALFEERRANRLAALAREYELEGGKVTELRAPAAPQAPAPRATEPDAATDDEKDFRRYTVDRLAAAWRDAWNDGKTEGRDYMETALWNLRGMKMIGGVGQAVAFDGRRHESAAPVFTDDPVTIVRPGWLLEVDDDVYVALKAAVEKM